MFQGFIGSSDTSGTRHQPGMFWMLSKAADPKINTIRLLLGQFSILFLDWIVDENFAIQNTTFNDFEMLHEESLKTFGDFTTPGAVYIKVNCRKVEYHRNTCDDILNDNNSTSHCKAFTTRIRRDVELKDAEEMHTIWYVGETVRSASV